MINSTWFIKLLYPLYHDETIKKYSKQFDVDPYLVAAVIRVESKFYHKAESRVGAKGLMQIMPETGEWVANKLLLENYTVEKLYDPEYNIQIGIWYLAYLIGEFDGDIVKSLAAYNAGENKVRKWLKAGIWSGNFNDIENIPFPETRSYVDRVMYDYQVYKKIYQN